VEKGVVVDVYHVLYCIVTEFIKKGKGTVAYIVVNRIEPRRTVSYMLPMATWTSPFASALDC
jgi:hypothetical protein